MNIKFFFPFFLVFLLTACTPQPRQQMKLAAEEQVKAQAYAPESIDVVSFQLSDTVTTREQYQALVDYQEEVLAVYRKDRQDLLRQIDNGRVMADLNSAYELELDRYALELAEVDSMITVDSLLLMRYQNDVRHADQSIYAYVGKLIFRENDRWGEERLAIHLYEFSPDYALRGVLAKNVP